MNQSYQFNIGQLEKVASALSDLLPSVTFVGGCTTSLLVDEAAFFGVRQTDDVDVIVDITTYVEYQKFGEQLRKRGFREDIDGPICRWLLRNFEFDIKLDVMPVDKSILGFSNRWYADAAKEASRISLPTGVEINVVGAVYFLATKFEAFCNRGKNDLFSHDLEDIVFVLENRSTIKADLASAPDRIKAYLSQQASGLLTDAFLNVLPGLLNNPGSSAYVREILQYMASENF